MSLSSALNAALSGLTTTARLADVVSSNVANASTEGYGARSADLAAIYLGSDGAGVRVTGIARSIDSVLLHDRRQAEADTGFSAAQNETLRRLEDIFGAVGSEDTLAAHLSRFEASLIEASADPYNEQGLMLVTSRLGRITDEINTRADRIQTMRAEADNSISVQVENLNGYLEHLEKLNSQIVASKEGSSARATLQDQKQSLIDKISMIAPVREISGERGQTTLVTRSGQILFDGRAARIAFNAHATITADMTLQSGALSGLTLNGQPLDNGFGRLSGGTLEAAFVARDGSLVQAQQDLDLFAFDFATRLSQSDSSLFAGETGLLTDHGAPVSGANLGGLAGRLTVNPVAMSNPATVRTGVGSGPITQDSSQLVRWADAIQARQSHAITGSTSSLMSYAASLSSKASQNRVLSDENHHFSSARSDALRASEYENGVDTDAEMQRLLQIERAYAANTRLIQTADAMLQTLMEI